MATFPRTVFTAGSAAMSGLVNTAADLGFTTDADFDAQGAMAAIVQNMAQDKSQTISAGAGITSGTGTICKSSVTTEGGVITTRFLIDLTGLGSSATGDDIIGNGTGVAYIGQITAAVNGTIKGGRMVCLEATAGGDADVDLWAATENTGAFDAAISGLVEAQVFNSGGVSLGSVTPAVADTPAANKYLYLCGGTGSAATYTAGRLLIEFYGV